MENLLRGLQEFYNNHFQTQRELFESLAHGQQPEVLFITCSDSRIAPSLLMQTRPGEVFMLRNAGNIIPPYGAAQGGEGATIEYAVSVLGVKHIVVCGHSDCGAMRALLQRERIADLPAVAAWLSHAEATRRIVMGANEHHDPAELLDRAIEQNVLVQMEHLRTHPSVAARLAHGALRLHGWVYHIHTGDVTAYNDETGGFASILKPPAASAQAV
jgi:carbonic anhydrase